jgi:pimeloyl-ACP methyl ester carboxylesterase
MKAMWMEAKMAMKVLRWTVTMVLWVAGALLLIKPLSAQTAAGAATHGAAAPATTAHAATQAPGKVGAFVPTRFTVVDAGTVGKPDVVMIPGLGSGRAVWDGEVKLLAPNYRLHVLQLNGFGGSAAGANAAGAILPGVVEELHQYIEANKMQPAVVGHSMGGLLAMMLADKYPADVRKMAIVDTLPYYAVLFKPDATVATMQPTAEVLRKQIVAAPADQFALMQTTVVPGLVKNADAQKVVEAMDVGDDRTVFAQTMYDDLVTDLRGDLAGMKTPMLLVYPYDATSQGPDPAKVDAMYKSAYAAKPNVTLVRVNDSRHFVMYDQPVKLDAALEGFLK